MRRFVNTFLFFVAISLIGYIFFTVLMAEFAPQGIAKNLKYPKNGTGFLQVRLSDADTSTNVDILVLGSSHAYRGYDPRIFSDHGINLFNLGSSSQTFTQSEFFLNKYLDKLNPKKVIIDVYGGLLASDGLESSLDIIANARNLASKDMFSLVWEQGDINLVNAFIYSLYDRRFNKFEVPTLVNGDNIYVDNGYVENHISKVDSSIPDFNIEIKDKQLEALAKIVETLERRGVPYRLVQTPISEIKNASMPNLGDMDTIFNKYGVYHNFNDSIKLDNSHFLDDHHLNQKGAEVYNRELIQTLKNDDFIKL